MQTKKDKEKREILIEASKLLYGAHYISKSARAMRVSVDVAKNYSSGRTAIPDESLRAILLDMKKHNKRIEHMRERVLSTLSLDS